MRSQGDTGPTTLDSHTYYFAIGAGRWAGAFMFSIIDWGRLRRASIGARNLFLVVAMHVILKFLGKARIISIVIPQPKLGPAGQATNHVRISKLGVTLYVLDERYELDPGGTEVRVVSRERFGPVPFLFRESKVAPAEIKPGGLGAIYQIPLLGDDWIGDYTVGSDRNHIDASLRCPWSLIKEAIARVSAPPVPGRPMNS